MQNLGGNPEALPATPKVLEVVRRPQAPTTKFPRVIPPVVSERDVTPKLSYAICTNPRSGSWVLSQGLMSTSRAGYPLEWLNIGEEQKRSARWGLKFPDDPGLHNYLARVLQRGQTSNGIFGIKLHYYQFVDLQMRMTTAGKSDELPIAKFMPTVFPNIQYLWLTRRDKARQAISFYRAWKTGVWWVPDRARPTREARKAVDVDFDLSTIMTLEKILHQNDRGWQSYFSENGIEPFTLFYEDFVESYAESIRATLKWLNISEAETVPIHGPRLRRQSDAQTEEWLVEYLEFKEASRQKVEAEASVGKPAIEIVSPLYDLTTMFRDRARIPQRPYKVISLLEALRKLQGLHARANTVERRSTLSRDAFLQQFYSQNFPVIIQGIMGDWLAPSLWTPQYLKEKAGNDQVEIQAGRNPDSADALTARSYKKTLRFSEYIDLMYGGVDTDDYRIEADKSFFQNQGAKDLRKDFVCFREYLEAYDHEIDSYFWFGPRGNVIPLHHATRNYLLAQVAGKRHYKMIPATEWQYVYNEIGNSSQVDCDRPDLDRWPLFRNATVMEFDLEPGEVLFMPVGWWCYSKALDVTIAISFVNFVFPNRYAWPEQQRDLDISAERW
jgi:LPS sulfotransferase NodH